MNVDGGPVANSVVLVGRDSDDAEFTENGGKVLSQMSGPFAVLFGGDDEEVWRELLDVVVDVGLVGHFPDDFNPRAALQAFRAVTPRASALGLLATKISDVLTILSSLGEHQRWVD